MESSEWEREPYFVRGVKEGSQRKGIIELSLSSGEIPGEAVWVAWLQTQPGGNRV